MPIRRPRGPKPVLRHVAFMETMASAVEGTPIHHGAHAALLTLRLLDHWIALGPEMASSENPSHHAAREATTTLSGDDEMRAALSSILDGIVALQEPDAQPLLPRVFALGKLLEQRGLVTQAGDVYSTITRYVDGAVHLDLAFDAHMRNGFCLRTAGEFEWADQAYATAGSLAARARDRVRVIYARAGQAKVEWARGVYESASVVSGYCPNMDFRATSRNGAAHWFASVGCVTVAYAILRRYSSGAVRSIVRLTGSRRGSLNDQQTQIASRGGQAGRGGAPAHPQKPAHAGF